jgi:Holliday junction DNA helicase RuvB
MNGVRDQFIYWDLPPFTLIGATTDAGDLPQPLVDRLKTHIYMEPYTADEMRRITVSHAAKAVERAEEIAHENSGTTFYPRIWNEGAIEAIAIRSRSTPRIAASLVAEVASWAVVERASVVGIVLVDRVMAALGIDACGLGELDRRIMRTLAAVGKPVGIEALAAMLHDTRNNIVMAERYLMSLEAVHRTARGRELTRKGTDMVAEWDGGPGGDDTEDSIGDLTMLKEMVAMIDDEDDEFEAPAVTAAPTVTTKDPWAAARDPNPTPMPGSM